MTHPRPFRSPALLATLLFVLVAAGLSRSGRAGGEGDQEEGLVDAVTRLKRTSPPVGSTPRSWSGSRNTSGSSTDRASPFSWSNTT